MFKKLFVLLKRESRIILFLLSLLLKFCISFILITVIPVIIFIFFIKVQPREVKSINNYLDKKIESLHIVKNVKYDNAVLTSSKLFSIDYVLNNVVINDDNFNISVPKVVFSIDITNLLKLKYLFTNIKIYELDGTVNVYNMLNNNSTNDTKTTNNNINVESILNYVQDYTKILNKQIILKSVEIEKSKLIVYDRDNKINNIKIDSGKFRTKYNSRRLDVIFNLKSNLNGRDDFFDTQNRCEYIFKNKDLNCEIALNKIPFNELNKLLAKDSHTIKSFSDNINGIFDVKVKLNIRNTFDVENIKYELKSDNGNFHLKQLFGGNIRYKNLLASGRVLDNGISISIDNLQSDLFVRNSKIMKLNANFLFKKEEYIKTDIKVDSARIENLDILWPVFLDQNGIREWVVEHFKYGQGDNLYANMLFEYNTTTKEFEFSKILAGLNFSDTFLDYNPKDMPPFSKLKGKAQFTENDIIIDINSGLFENTKLNNGKVVIDYNDPRYALQITGSGIGPAYEAGYFIDYKTKDTIKELLGFYTNGTAYSTVNLNIPLNDNDDKNFDMFSETKIDIKSNIVNNNNFLFSDNSELKLKLKKDIGSNIFKSNIDFIKAKIDFNTFNILKEKNIPLKVDFNIVINDDNVLLNNFNSSNKQILDIDGDGVINNGILERLTLDKVIINNNPFVFNLSIKNNKDININIFGEKLDFITDSSKNTNINFKNDFKNITDFNIDLKSNFKQLVINSKYKTNETNINIIYKYKNLSDLYISSTLDDKSAIKVNISNKHNDYSDFDIKITNLGNVASKYNILDNLVGGDFYFDGKAYSDNIVARIKIANKFNFIASETKNIKFLNSILNHELLPKSFVKNLKEKNTIEFKKAEAEVIITDENVKIKGFSVESGETFSGFGISGYGNLNYKTGKVNIDGVLIPLDKLNTLFGANKIPVINSALFGGKYGGLMTIGYSFKKENYKSDYEFKIVPVNKMSISTLKNLLVLFLFI